MRNLGVLFFAVVLLVTTVYSDATFDNLIASAKYKEALDYADKNIQPADRTADVWVKIAKANEKLGLVEKALASYMVSWRMNPNHYPSLLGAAEVYNKLKQYDNAANMAKKALALKFTGEASWEYAKACIALKKPAEAKKALEKVIDTDPGNAVANSALGTIYFDDKQYSKAIPLLKKSYSSKSSADVAYKIGLSYLKTSDNSNAITYLTKAVSANPKLYEAQLELARALYSEGKYSEASSYYTKLNGKITLKASDLFANADALEKSGKKTAAISAYSVAIAKYGKSRDKKALVSRYKVGKASLESKNYTRALEQFKFLVAADPKATMFSDVYFMLADSYIGLKKRTDAISTLNRQISIDSKNAEAYARLADLYTKAKMSDKAKATYEKLLSLSPNDPNVYLVLGNYNLKAKNYTKAMSLFVKSNTLKKNADALEGIALCAYNTKQWEKARDAAESSVSLDPSKKEARIVLANMLLKSKSYNEAKVQFEKLLSSDSNNLKYMKNLALCYENLGLKNELASIDTKIVARDKKDVKSRKRLGEYSLAKGNKEKAYELYKELSVLTPNNSGVFKTLYKLSIEKKDTTTAIMYLKKYVVINTKDAEAQRDLGNLLYAKKNYDGALVAYRKAVAIDPAIKGFYKNYADVVMKKGLQGELIKALNGVIKNGDANYGTYSTLGMIYMKKKLYSKAKTMYQKALMLEPQNADALVQMGECQTKLNDIAGAVISYEQAVMMNPKLTNAYKVLGSLYKKQSKTEQSVKSYKKYLDLGGTDPDVTLAVGTSFLSKKNYKEAVKYLAKVKGKQSKSFLYQLNLCTAYFETGDFKNTVIMADKLIKRQPSVKSKIKIYKMKTLALEGLKRYAEAAKVADSYCSLNSRDKDMAFKRAELREKMNSPTNAIKYYKLNISKFPNDSRNYLQLGLIYTKNKSTLSKAAPMLEKAAAKAGKDKKIWKTIAEIYGKLGKGDKELAAYKKYIDADPQNVEANIRIGSILLEKNKVSDAMIYLETANTLSPNNIKIMGPLASGYLKSKRYTEALSILQKAKSIQPDNVDIRKRLFKVYIKTGDKKSALTEIKELIDKKHDNSLILMYAKMLFEEGKLKDAMNSIEDIMATDPENIDALMLSAKINRAKKKFNDAIETYKEITYIDANNVEALYQRAETYLEMSKPQWAERFYERALRADPKFGLAELGRAKIARLLKNEAGYKSHLKKALSLSPNNTEIRAAAKAAGLI